MEAGRLLPTSLTTYTVKVYRVRGWREERVVEISLGVTTTVATLVPSLHASTSTPTLALDPLDW